VLHIYIYIYDISSLRFNQSVCQSLCQSVDRSVSHSISQSVIRSVTHLVSLSVGRSVSQLVIRHIFCVVISDDKINAMFLVRVFSDLCCELLKEKLFPAAVWPHSLSLSLSLPPTLRPPSLIHLQITKTKSSLP